MTAQECKTVALLVNRRCNRCGAKIFQTPGSFAGLLDSVIFTKTVLRYPCHGVLPQICQKCWQVEKYHKVMENFDRG